MSSRPARASGVGVGVLSALLWRLMPPVRVFFRRSRQNGAAARHAAYGDVCRVVVRSGSCLLGTGGHWHCAMATTTNSSKRPAGEPLESAIATRSRAEAGFRNALHRDQTSCGSARNKKRNKTQPRFRTKWHPASCSLHANTMSLRLCRRPCSVYACHAATVPPPP